MADGQMAREPVQHRLVEDVRHQSQALMLPDLVIIAGNYAARFLTAVLQGVETEIGQAGGFGMAVDAEDATVFLGTGISCGAGKWGIIKNHLFINIKKKCLETTGNEKQKGGRRLASCLLILF